MNFFKLVDNFRLRDEKESYDTVIDSIEKGVVFRGTNLWILIFAILIASLGLNINSTAVIIGAMLISPLMGPIIGVGLSLGINDLQLLRKALQNYFFALIVGLATSTIYFLLSPFHEAHAEILSRTQPNIYDVLIAFFGGFAGIIAVGSKQKGNVIPGVAIATALMPPLCTAGYGLATLQWKFFLGAFYLFLINSVFIGLSTLITVRYMRFPVKHLLDASKELVAKRIIWVVILLTILPSLYLGYTFVQDNRFIQKVNNFIELETRLPDEYLLNKQINVSERKVTLTFGGAKLSDEQIKLLQKRFGEYKLGKKANLDVKQGFSYLDEKTYSDIDNSRLSEKEVLIVNLQNKIDSLSKFDNLGGPIFRELKINYPSILSVSLTKGVFYNDSSYKPLPVCIITEKEKLTKPEMQKINNWLKIRLNVDSISVFVRESGNGN